MDGKNFARTAKNYAQRKNAREDGDKVIKKDKRKQSIYMPEEMLEEVKLECETYGIALSKAVQDAWLIARDCDCPLPKGVAIFRHKNRKHK